MKPFPFVLLTLFFWLFQVSGQGLLKETRVDSIAVFFESGTYSVKKKDILLSRIAQIQKQPLGKIVLIGYADSLGSKESNKVLASKRLQSVQDILKNSKLKEYLTDTLNLDEEHDKALLDSEQSRRVDILIYNIEANYSMGKPISLNIQFQVASDYVLSSSTPALKELLYVMKLNPKLEIKLNGHVCCMPQQVLSLDRAKRVKIFLVQNGIDGKRITCFGYSNTVKLVEEVSPETQAINRRVEVVFLKND